jgi:hypothetical protein
LEPRVSGHAPGGQGPRVDLVDDDPAAAYGEAVETLLAAADDVAWNCQHETRR